MTTKKYFDFHTSNAVDPSKVVFIWIQSCFVCVACMHATPKRGDLVQSAVIKSPSNTPNHSQQLNCRNNDEKMLFTWTQTFFLRLVCVKSENCEERYVFGLYYNYCRSIRVQCYLYIFTFLLFLNSLFSFIWGTFFLHK